MSIDLGQRYELLRELGRGGVGRVFLVRDLYLKEELALKLLHDPPITAEDLEQAQREFALLSEIDHPGIARAHDFGYLDGRPYFTSEYIHGEPLSAIGPVAQEVELLRLARDLAEAVAFLHQRGILHLDIKPSNIILSGPATQGRAVLIDFGLFRRRLELKAEEKIKGSLPYMAPECFRREKPGPWTDVYALGVTLYQAATGSLPRARPSKEAFHAEDLSGWDPAPRPPAQLNPALPASLDPVILKCLALDPRSRFPSASELLAALCRLEGTAPSRSVPGALAPPTVGRPAELRKVDEFLDGLLKGSDRPQALLITGPPGMGQTHLLREMKVRAQTRGLHFYLETGYRGQSTVPGSVLRCLGAHLGGDEEARSRWERFLAHLRRPRHPARSETTEGERRMRRAAEAARAASRVRDPMVLAVDGLQLLDEVSAGLVIDLVRGLSEETCDRPPPIGIAVAYREEGPLASMLEELTECLLQPGKGSVITLGPLGLEETKELFRRCRGPEADGLRGLAILQETGGSPARIALLAGQASGGRAEENRASASALAPLRTTMDRESRRLLVALELLQRPARSAELASFMGWSAARAGRTLERLGKEGLVARVELASGETGWLPEGASRAIASRASVSERRTLHLRIGKRLLQGRASASRLVEAVRHFRAAGSRSEVVKHGLLAARWLKSNFQNQAALEMLRGTFEALPARRRARRLEVALEVADLHSRVGDIDEGISVLREVLPSSRRLSTRARKMAVLALAALYSRRGDFQRADLLFEEGLSRLTFSPTPGKPAEGQADLSREEVLFFLNEHAALKTALGEYVQARDLCEKGLRVARRGRGARVREVALNLHATRANIALRTYDFESALRDFEDSLRIAEAIGSTVSQATVLNNLGVVHVQCDRYQEAIRCFREAEKYCLRLDEGPSLASIYGNLAVLHAKVGDLDSMERALQDGERLLPRGIGRRQEFFLRHARGLSLLVRGRYAEARQWLEKAIELGDAVGDRHVAVFDRAHRAEALLFEGAYREAASALRSLSQPEWPGRVRKVALARLAFLEAITARKEEAEQSAAKHAELSAERPVPYLDAWDDLFLGWAFSILGARDRAQAHLDRAESFFRSGNLRPALSLTVWVRAEALFLQGKRERAMELLGASTARGEEEPTARSDLTAVLWPLLEARLRLERAGRGEAARCADLIAEAGAALVGNPLPEWEARLEALRGVLVPTEGRAERLREGLARSLPEEQRRLYSRSEHWLAWSSIANAAGLEAAEARAEREGQSLARTDTVALGERRPRTFRARLVGRSPGMRCLFTLLDRLREQDLPVLITGETGTGKELVARSIHEESRRAAKEFRVVDCATLPSGLLETELFGARKGAFTDMAEDRPGILTSADGGTVLIDEIGGAPLEVQAKLLRVLSSGTLRAVGSEEETRIDVRFLFSTSKDLEAETRAGRFRADLLHRIQVIALRVPPLRERHEDLPDLTAALLADLGAPSLSLEPGALERLGELPWPGNVRELRNFLARAHIESPGAISLQAIERARADARTTTFFPRNLLAQEALPALKERLERDYIVHHLRRLEGDTDALCRFLGIRRRQLYRRCERLGIRLRPEARSRQGPPDPEREA
ncbi:MAG: sigma 54-interacting transcriptional regulator [Planctomycetes bacterium]|nr:sigma 54-interacting transcriptional regulator [Planctomycetota bacterium]